MFSADPYVLDMYRLLLKDNLHWQDREAWIYSQNVYTRYPYQSALHGLPAPVIKECILGAVEARYGGTTTATLSGDRSASQPDDCCADGVVPGGDCVLTARDKSASSFEAFIYQTWGRALRAILLFPTTASCGRCHLPRWRPHGWAAACRSRIWDRSSRGR